MSIDRRRRVKGALREIPSPSVAAQRAEVVRERLEEMVGEFSLSPREREVFELLLYGRTADEIADRLGVSTRTVKFHQTNLLDKLDADSRLDLFRLFFDPD
jgi:RNA polymerase sigma factor (sigma-70 family)